MNVLISVVALVLSFTVGFPIYFLILKAREGKYKYDMSSLLVAGTGVYNTIMFSIKFYVEYNLNFISNFVLSILGGLLLYFIFKLILLLIQNDYIITKLDNLLNSLEKNK